MTTETYKDKKAIHPRTRKEWRQWLEKNHEAETSVWLIFYRKGSDVPTLTYDEAVEEALCFGWIDSVVNRRDEQSRYQFYSKRKPKSNWSMANRGRVERLTAQGLIKPAGQKLIDLAKETGTWDALVDVQNAVIPDDLQKRFNRNKKALIHFLAFPPSAKRVILEWLLSAKTPATRKKRIDDIVQKAAQNIRSNQYIRKNT